jgi:hypothetical protein
MSIDNKKIIFEQAFSGDVEIIEESMAPGGQYKIIFRAKLQEADVVNNNKRVYPAETLEAVYDQLKEKALARKLVGELDHPQPSGDSASKMKRSSTIALQNACILITDVEWDGSSLYGICETLSNTKGMDLYCLLKDKVTIGFSLRAFGETRNKGGGVVEVVARGIKALTYDVVANPSHDSSVIIDILQEGTSSRELINELKLEVIEESNAIMSKMTLLEESTSSGISLEENAIIDQISSGAKKVCIGNICTIAPLEEAISYLLDQVVSDTSIPNIRVSKL